MNSIPAYLALLILFLPLAGGFLSLMRGKAGVILMNVATGLAMILAAILVVSAGETPMHASFQWFAIGTHSFTAGIRLDHAASFMTLIVVLITFLVGMFSLVYMRNDEGIRRYFCALGFFATCMLGIVMADNLLMIFFFWELVGFSSYLLINHYVTRDSANLAAMKAFLVNRIGDVGFILGLAIVWANYQTFDLTALEAASTGGWSTAAGLCIFLGVVGKSAQFPLQVWLPDAMEGPTPASALIHAATMVAAGVYLLFRTITFFDPTALLVIAVIGAITAFMGAVAAVSQFDIKKVLAFSTISQLGYMVMAMGVAAREEALMHLYSHAFFKAGLFLAAGSIIHALHEQAALAGKKYDAQDMRNMGGLRHSMPWTFILYLIFTAGLIGLPFTGGFLTKDAILTAAVAWLDGDFSILSIIPLLALGTVALTAFYMVRQVFLVFWGESRVPGMQTVAPAEVPWLMRFPLVVLAAGSCWFLYSPNPFIFDSGWLQGWLFGEIPHDSGSLHWIVSGTAFGMILLGGLPAYFIYRNSNTKVSGNFFARLSVNNWWLDELYDQVVVKPVKFISRLADGADRLILDRFINFLGIIYVLFCHIVAWFDKNIVDGSVHVVAGTARMTGGIAAYVTRGGVQFYLWIAVILALTLLWIVI